MLQVQQNPSKCVGTIPDLLDMLTSDEFPPQERYSVPEIFRTLAREQPSAFEQHLDTLFSLLQDPTAPYQANSADEVIRELYVADIQRDTIVERVSKLLKQDTEREIERAICLLGIRTLDLTAYEETLDRLIEVLDDEMKPQLMLPTVDALFNSTIAKKGNSVLSKLATKDRVGTLVTLLRFGHDRRGRDEDAWSMSTSVETSTDADGQPHSERETELDTDELYHLNERVAGQLRALATVYPNTVTPHLGRILLDLKTEAKSLENVRANALKIVEGLLDADPESLSSAIERHRATVRELVQHSEAQISEVALQLLSRSGVEQDKETLQEIASTPSHKLWQTARTLVESETSDQRGDSDLGDTVAGGLDRLKHLPTDKLPPLHLPTPDEIQNHRTTAGLERVDVSDVIGYHQSYLKALEEGLLNPPLSVLVEISVRIAPDDTLINEFPTGARIQSRRTTADDSLAMVADQAGLSTARLQAIEDGAVDPQAQEVEQLLIAIGDAKEPAAYPDKPPLHEAWIKYGTALALELGRLPKSKELVEYPDARGDDSVPNRDPGFNGDEEVNVDVEMPEPPHWAVFDSWDELLAELEVDNEYRTSGAPLRSSLLADLRTVAKQVSGRPTTTAIDEHSEYSYHYYKKEFGGIQAAREAAGLE
jgi:transcriptional regulator with XRE-family HTH domain